MSARRGTLQFSWISTLAFAPWRRRMNVLEQSWRSYLRLSSEIVG